MILRPSSAGEVAQLIVMAGSCSAARLRQIEWAEAHGYASVRLDAAALLNDSESERARLRHAALPLLESAHGLVLYSARGPQDEVMQASNAVLERRGLDELTIREQLGAQ